MNRLPIKILLFLLLSLFVGLSLFFGACKTTEPAAGPPGLQGKADRYEELIRSPEKGHLTIYFLDLSVSPQAEDKSGDAMLLILPDGLVMMVDSGHPESAADSLALLSELGIARIDYFFITHPHIDHIGGFPAIAEKYEIGEVFQTDIEYITETYRLYKKVIETHRIPVRSLKRGDTLLLGEEITAQVFNPPDEIKYPQNFPANSTQFINDNSMVVKLSWGKSDILLGGDIYLTRERDISELYGEELHAIVSKANHHGNDSSNGAWWIRTVQPELVVAMDDKISSMTVYNNFKKSGAVYYHTSLDGLVRVTLNREGEYSVVSRFDSWLRD